MSSDFQYTKNQEISLFPTEGEIYRYYLENFMSSEYLMCKIDTKVPYVQLLNIYEEIYQIQGDQFISMSQNETHFCTLSNENVIIIYEWNNQMIQQVGSPVIIDSSFNCFNINLFENFSILVDCYQNNEFFFIQLMNEQPKIAYSIPSSIPTQTKMQSIINETNAFIVYAQYFEDYSILTLFSSSFLNQSSLNQQFVDFDIPNKISPNIYLITIQEIFMLSISSDSHFILISNLSQDNMCQYCDYQITNFTNIIVFYDLWTYSQCDQIQLLYYQPYQEVCIYYLIACKNIIIFEKNDCSIQQDSILNIFQNNQFIIYQFANTIVISEKQSNQMISNYLQHQSNSLLYFNYDNELFIFNKDITAYKIQIPSLQVNLTNLQIAGDNFTFSLICHNQGQKSNYYGKINLQVLSQNDTNIYVMFNQDFPQYQTSITIPVTNNFFSFSGQLLQYKLNSNEIPLNFSLIASQKAGQINQSYLLIQSLSIIQKNESIVQYLIGYNNYSIDVLECQSVNIDYIYQFTKQSSIKISVNANALQIAYSIYPKMIIIGLSTNDIIYIFYYYIDNSSMISYSNYTFEQQFSDFVVTYNNIIILILNQEIKIMTFDFINIFTLNQQSINKLFDKINFNPIQIIMNTQLQSSLLYINNINEVIIFSIDQNSFPIPISLIKVNFIIKQINLINVQLIISYLCNNDQNICFQVWNVQYLPKYNYVKNLQSVNIDNKVIIQSDNMFLYVTFSNQTVYVYNPSLTYHQSLYYLLELTSPIQCTQAIQTFYYYVPQFQYQKSIIILKDNTIYQLSRMQEFQISAEYKNEDFNNSIRYPQFIYNYSVTSALNKTAFYWTPNQSITLYSNYTVFLNQRNLSINLNLDNIIAYTRYFSFPINLILDRQVGYCGSTNLTQTYDLNKDCNLTQLYYRNSRSILNDNNFSLITQINNEFFAFQNNSYIQTLSSDFNNLSNLSYQYLNLSICLKSTSYKYTLYSICQNTTSQYLLNFTLNFEGNIIINLVTQLPQQFHNISKINTILNQIFILGFIDGSNQLYQFNQSNNILYSINNTVSDFSITLMPKRFEDDQLQQIIIFYIFIQTIEYKIMSIGDQFVQFQNQGQVSLYFCDEDNGCYQPLIQFYLIYVMQTSQQKVMILLSDSYFSYIVVLILKQIISQNGNFYNGRIIRTIPNLYNLTNTGNSFYQYGVLMQQFQSNNKTIVGTYYIEDFLDNNIMEPILMQGSFSTTVPDYAIIVDQQYRNGTSLYIYNQSINNYSIGTWNVTCFMNRYTQKSVNVSIFCKNEFSNGNYSITFITPTMASSKKNWIYTLISMIGLLLLYFYIKVKQQKKYLDYNEQEIEL
ncbi:unnamed protein product [Paramecium pentaurelia]|uniref:Transmembrane protein n=1 Tax=Paramecium pentaurelia TaxID=43138 RepID=A0A8S1UUK5_9CILI|nr:unnamed protein product [Paramecium pentaurelia]